MTQLRDQLGFMSDAWQSFRTMLASVRWVPRMYSKRGMRYMRYALAIYVTANVLEQLAIYFGGQLIGGHGTHSYDTVLLLIGLLAGSWIGGIVLERLGNRVREWGWNLNDRGLYQNLTRQWKRKTPGETMAEDRTIGPYQIESSASRMHNMQFVIFFHLMNVGATILVTTGFILYTDVVAGATIVGVLLGNLVAIFFINHYVHERARVIDEKMRAITNRLVEYWQNSIYIVGTGNERTVLRWLKRAQLPVYLDDFRLWGTWYTTVDGLRSIVTNLVLVGILWYGYQSWETAELASMFGWLLVYREQFWQIADIQRQLARDAEPIHALRHELERPVAFEQGAFTSTNLKGTDNGS